MSYADPSDVAVELGRPADSVTEAESAQWQVWLDRVERAIARGFRRAGLVLADQVALNDPAEDDVMDVEIAAVVRRIEWAQREGRTSTTRSVDDASVTDRWESDSEGLVLTSDEWDALLPTTRSDAFSTRPSFAPDCGPGRYWG
jgi:hypothetical protein